MEQRIGDVVRELFGIEIVPQVSRPEPQFGDWATNVALQLAGQLGRAPREIAEEIANHLRESGDYSEVAVAGPGFINLRLSDDALISAALHGPANSLDGVSYVVEYSCPNAFKELHTGHLYQTILGDVIARLVEATGAQTHRTSFGGDVGLHVAKCLYGMVTTLGGEFPEKLAEVSADAMKRAYWVSQCYVRGAKAHEESEDAKQAIEGYNQAIYQIHANNDHDSALAQLYWETRQWSYDYFEAFYRLIHVDLMRYYPESSTLGRGLELVHEGLEKGYFTESEGAVVFEGDPEQHLHTRVFVTSKGLPTYETKDLGVIFMEKADYGFDRRVLVTGNDQTAYMRVVFAAADKLEPGIASSMSHITNGTVRFGDGQKMSSRLGNVSRAIDVLEVVREKVRSLGTEEADVDMVALGAIKYEFLKYRVGGDIAFDIEESVSIQGNSGPYLQYAHARACSILSKSETSSPEALGAGLALDSDERQLVSKLGEYAEVVEKATKELMPHLICTYLYELAQEFNRFYEKCRIIGDERETERLSLVVHYRDTLARGLGLLGIVAPEKM